MIRITRKNSAWTGLVVLILAAVFTACPTDNEMSQPTEYVTFNGRITAKDRSGTPIVGEVRITLWCNYPGDGEHKNDDEKTVIVKLDSSGKASWEITGKRADFRKYDKFGVIFSQSVKCDDLGSYRLYNSVENYDCGDMLFSPISGTLKEGENPVSGRTLYVLEEPFRTVSDVWKDNPDKAVMSIWMGDQEEGKFSAHTQTPVSRGLPVTCILRFFTGEGTRTTRQRPQKSLQKYRLARMVLPLDRTSIAGQSFHSIDSDAETAWFCVIFGPLRFPVLQRKGAWHRF
jgi:hypothetical protein